MNCSKTILVNSAHKSDPSVFLRAYAIIDEHSNCTLIDPKVIDLLNLKSELHNYSVNTVGGCESVTSGRIVKGLQVSSIRSTNWIDLPDTLTNNSIPNTLSEVASKSLVKKHNKITRYS